MSLVGMSVAKVLDPRLNVSEKREYISLKGSQVNNFQEFPCNNISNSSLTIVCNPPSSQIAVSRLVYQKYVFDVTITGTNATVAPNQTGLLVSGAYAPRAYPLAMVTNTLNVTLNDATVTLSPLQQYQGALMWYANPLQQRAGQNSLTPSMLDQSQQYSDLAGFVKNPLGAYGENTAEESRGAFVGMVVNSNAVGGTSANLTLTVVEPLMISPFSFGVNSNESESFFQLKNMTYNVTLGDLSRVMSLVQNQNSPGLINISSVAVNLQSASLLFNYFTPDSLEKIPRAMVYPYYNIVPVPTQIQQTVAPGGLLTISMQSYQLSSIPSRLYFFAREPDSSRTAFTTDTYMSLDSSAPPVRITWNNNQFLSTASAYDLYNISVKNGYQGSYNQWGNKTGSILALDLSTDIGLAPDEAPGVLGTYQLSGTFTFVNRKSSSLVNPTLFCVIVYEGSFEIVDGQASKSISSLTRLDVLGATEKPYVEFNKNKNIYGGAWFDKLKNFAKKSKIASSALDALGQRELGTVARSLGYGVSPRIGRGVSGGGVSGGRMSKKDIERRLMHG